jgi:hypothetical protein
MGIITYLKLGAAAAILAVVVAAGWTVNGWYQDSKILKQAVSALSAMTIERDMLQSAIVTWQKAADAQQKRADVAEAKAQEIIVQWKEKTVYVSGPIPAPGDACPERLELTWLVTEYEALRSSW